MMHVPENSRVANIFNAAGSGNNGSFQLTLKNGSRAFVIASDGMGWEHVSVSMLTSSGSATPSWDEMCLIKDIFWDEEDCVIQFHPPKSEYVNNHPNVLHLWRPTNSEIPRPLPIQVGFVNKS